MNTYRTAVGLAMIFLLLGACGGPDTNEEEGATLAAPPVVAPEGSHDPETDDPEVEGSEPDATAGAGGMDEAVALASAYLQARNAYDVEGARQLVADGFRTTEAPDGYTDVGSMQRAFEQHQAFGFHFAEVECAPLSETPKRLEVQCDYLWSTELHRIGGHAPTPVELRVFVADGQIVEVLVDSAPYFSWWGPFIGFVREHDVAFGRVIDDALRLEPEAHRELVERLPEFLQRYEQWLDQPDD
jgi:hypothetical protein